MILIHTLLSERTTRSSNPKETKTVMKLVHTTYARKTEQSNILLHLKAVRECKPVSILTILSYQEITYHKASTLGMCGMDFSNSVRF